MDYALKITGGTIVDGTGAPGQRGDVGIRDGRIVALGDAPGTAHDTIDAHGRVVCPGFVDIHTHYDAQILWDRMMTISPWHGATTVVMGNCGFGVAPTRPQHRELILRTLEKVEGMSYDALKAGIGEDWPFESFAEYLDVVEQRAPAINVAVLAGHTPIRIYVMGEDAAEREATADEIDQMRALVHDAMEAGAVGFATSKAFTHVGAQGKPVPSRAASLDEVRALCGVLGEVGRGTIEVTIGPGMFLDQFEVIAQETGRPISWTALFTDMLGPGSHLGVLEQVGALQARGLQIYPQVSALPIVHDFRWAEPFPFAGFDFFKPITAGDHETKKRVYADPAFRADVKAHLAPGSGPHLAGWWTRAVISVCPSDPSLEERPLSEVAAERGVHPQDLAFDLGLESDLQARFRTATFNHNESAIGELLTSPYTMVGLSDAGAHADELNDACYGTNLLGTWVREREVLSLEQAVHMITHRPAQIFGLTDRGRLAEGAPADVVVFDPVTIGHSPLRRVWDLPAGADRVVTDPEGIDAVIVNGSLLRRNGVDAVDPEGTLAGRLLRHGRG